MQLQKAEAYIRKLLSTGLPANLHYHNLDHTLDVYQAVTSLALDEHIESESDLLLLKTAALFHDCGFVQVYNGHEKASCSIARAVLPGMDYSDEQINLICDLIMKTSLEEKPVSHSEKILCDADLDYLGRDDFETVGIRLFNEWLAIGKVIHFNEWNQLQVKFLHNHRYWTESARQKREKKKAENLKRIESRIRI